ncbi:MAG: carboxypeptidase-like regulatory domain-containing protein, partial [Ignavibacterium sp.]
MRKLLLFFTLFITAFSIVTFAQTGKINGYVRDAETGEELIGANVIIEGTTMGAATNIDGYYVITNV